jgi:hypothetical protein
MAGPVQASLWIRGRSCLFGILGAAGLLGAGQCQPPTPPAATPTPPAAALVDDQGGVDRTAFDALVAEIERVRGLRFVRRPDLGLVDPTSPEWAALAKTASGFEPIPPILASASSASPPVPASVGAALPDLDHNRVLAVAPLQPNEVRWALARLLDAQEYPRLVALAPHLPGDAGIAVRAVLEASARAAAGGTWFKGPYRGEEIDLLRNPPPGLGPRLPAAGVAALLMIQLDEPEVVFRKPPLSTKQLLSARDYLASDRPLRLRGPAPSLEGCQVGADESVGVYRLLFDESLANDRPTRESLAAWKGDRLVRLVCRGREGAWIYVAELSGAPQAKAFASHAIRLLPSDLGAPTGTRVVGTRVVAFRGIDPTSALAFAGALEADEVSRLEAWLGP